MRKTCAIFAVGAVVLAGCGGSVDGSAVADSPLEPWNPCSIPADAIESAGLDPDSMIEGWSDGIEVDHVSRCEWRGPKPKPSYIFTIRYQTEYTLDEARNDPSYSNRVDTSIGSMNAIVYNTQVGKPGVGCNVAVEVSDGVAKFGLNTIAGAAVEADPCNELVRYVQALAQYLPTEE